LRSLDTNVLARWLLGDDAAQCAVAARILAEPCWISHTMLVELGWVLNKSLGLSRDVVAAMIGQVLSLETVQCANRTGLEWALGRYADGADWADMVHLVSSSHEATCFATFDQALGVRAGSDSPLAVATLHG
jgi:predicted nucleic-acid-binding protein